MRTEQEKIANMKRQLKDDCKCQIHRLHLMSFVLVLLMISLSCNAYADSTSFSCPLADIAYETRKEDTVCKLLLPESGELIPFIVLKNVDNEGTLLLRECVLDVLCPFNENTDYPSYYAGSTIDCFLQEEYLPRLSESIQELIKETEIEITSLEAIVRRRGGTEYISRRVFLLSASEIGYFSRRTVEEGKQLRYFNQSGRLIACHQNQQPESWFTRTPVFTDNAMTIGVSFSGAIGSGPILHSQVPSSSGVRPAFCLPAQLNVELYLQSDVPNTYVLTNEIY